MVHEQSGTERKIKQPPVKRRRYEQDKEREDNLRARTETYVTEGCHSATQYCDVYTSF